MNRLLKRVLKKILSNDVVHNTLGKAYKEGNPSAKLYWEARYDSGGTSGSGSYGKLAKFKADIVNGFVNENDIQSVIEFGCGDGNQLSLMQYPQYIGMDVSPTAVELCKEKFCSDQTKSFFLYDSKCFVDNHSIFGAELSISLDVIYHLTDDEVYNSYMKHLFESSNKYVIIYSSNVRKDGPPHITHRKFTDWVDKKASSWKLKEKIENERSYNPENKEETTSADFYIYEK